MKTRTKLTRKDCGTGDGHGSAPDCSKIYVHRIYNAFEIERDLDI